MFSKLILIAWLLTAAGGFDPWKDLPGYQEAFLSDHSDLYDFDAFAEHEGRRLSESRLAEVRAEWGREKARVADRLRELASDPSRAFLRNLRGLLARDRFFKSVTFQERRGESDVLLLVQVPSKASRNHVEGVAQNYVAHIETLSRQFHEAYVEPLGLKRRKDASFLVIVSLKSRGAYDDYARSTPGGEANENVIAHYDPRHQIAVVWEPGTDPNAPNLRDRLEVLSHETVHALLDAYRTGGEPVSLWLNEGLAEYWSHSLGTVKTGSLAFRQKPATDLMTWRGLRASGAADVVIPPISSLVGYRAYSDAMKDILGRVSGSGHAISAQHALGVFYVTSCLLTMYLSEGADEEVRARFPRLLAAELAGRHGEEAFTQALGLDGYAELEALDRKFRDWVDELAAGRAPTADAPPREENGPAGESAVVDLGLGAPTELERLGTSLGRAARLDLAGAPADAEALSAADRAFLERARGHVTAVLEAAKTAGQNVVLDLPGGRVIGKVVRVGEREFEVAPYRKDPVRIERAEVDLDFLETYGRKFGVEDQSVVGGLRVLREGRPAPAVGADLGLSSDAIDRWVRALDAAVAREHLERVQAAMGDEGADLTAGLRSVEALLTRHASAASVTSRRDRLMDAARALYVWAYDPSRDSDASFTVPVVDVGDGVVELRYDFSDPAQLCDFVMGDAVPAYTKNVMPLLPITGQKGTWRVSGGRSRRPGTRTSRTGGSSAGLRSSSSRRPSWRTVSGRASISARSPASAPTDDSSAA